MIKTETAEVIQQVEAEGLQVMNWKPGNKRIFKILDSNSHEVTGGMFSEELRAWYKGYKMAKYLYTS